MKRGSSSPSLSLAAPDSMYAASTAADFCLFHVGRGEPGALPMPGTASSPAAASSPQHEGCVTSGMGFPFTVKRSGCNAAVGPQRALSSRSASFGAASLILQEYSLEQYMGFAGYVRVAMWALGFIAVVLFIVASVISYLLRGLYVAVCLNGAIVLMLLQWVCMALIWLLTLCSPGEA